MSSSGEVAAVQELQAKRAIAMAMKFLQSSSPVGTPRLRRLATFQQTLQSIALFQSLSEPTVLLIYDLAAKMENEKYRLLASDRTKSSRVPKEVFNPVIEDSADNSVDQIQRLLFEQKEMHSKELSHERKSQDVVITELTNMTDLLKQTTLKIHHSVRAQNLQLEQIQHFALENEVELNLQKKKMAERTKSMTRSMFASIALILWIVCFFVLTIVSMRYLPKPSSFECPNL